MEIHIYRIYTLYPFFKGLIDKGVYQITTFEVQMILSVEQRRTKGGHVVPLALHLHQCLSGCIWEFT